MSIKVFLVDDEEIVRNGLSENIPWDEYGMELVGMADDGQSAYEFLKCNDADILISDIYMPVMDGLELVEKLKKINKNPLVILISGYSDFKYAQKAIKTNMVSEYILKPINFEELDKAFAAAKAKILADADNHEFPILSDQEWNELAKSENNGELVKPSEVINKIEMCEVKEAHQLFDMTWKHLMIKNYSFNIVTRYCIELIMNIIEIVLEQRNSRDILKEDPISYIRTRHTKEEIKQYTKKMIDLSYKVISHKENKDLSPIINTALDYINQNYKDHEMSLNSLADKLNISPNYLCLRFKEETGINFTKYLNSLRVKHAKDLLKDVRLKVYMISDMVGFEDTRYFSRIFRSYTGYTPTEYQKNEAVRKLD